MSEMGENGLSSATLKRFLSARDLDELQAARMEISEITRADADRLAAFATGEGDTQVLANLLMYPEVIPERLRIATVVAALQGDPSDYLLLAAVVGAGRMEFGEDHGPYVAERLLELSAYAGPPVSIRAAHSFGKVARFHDVRVAVARLGDLRPTERHNILAGLVNEFGIGEIRHALALCRELSLMDTGDIDAIEQALANGENYPQSNLPIPLLTYIPNLDEWAPDAT